MPHCENCGKEIWGRKLRFCCTKCRKKYHRIKDRYTMKNIYAGDGYDPYLALWAAIMLPEGKRRKLLDNATVNPEMLSRVGHAMLERIATEMERYGKYSYFKKIFTMEKR